MPPFERGEGGVVVCPHVLRNEIEIVPGLVEKNAIYEIVHIYSISAVYSAVFVGTFIAGL